MIFIQNHKVFDNMSHWQKWEITYKKPDKNNSVILFRIFLSSTHETSEVSTHHIHSFIHYGHHDNLILPAVEALISSHFHWLHFQTHQYVQKYTSPEWQNME